MLDQSHQMMFGFNAGCGRGGGLYVGIFCPSSLLSPSEICIWDVIVAGINRLDLNKGTFERLDLKFSYESFNVIYGYTNYVFRIQRRGDYICFDVTDRIETSKYWEYNFERFIVVSASSETAYDQILAAARLVL